MILHIPTIITASAAILVLITVLLVFFGSRDAQSGPLLWWGVALAMGVIAALVLVRDSIEPSITCKRLGSLFIMMAYGFGWQATRAFHRRSHVALLVVLAGVLWFLSAVIAQKLSFGRVPYFAGTFIVAAFNALMLREFLTSREVLPSRRPMVFVLSGYVVWYTLRATFYLWLPQPLGRLPTETWAVAAYNIAVLSQVIIFAALLIALSRERNAAEALQLANIDPMTGAFNRRTLDAHLEIALQDSISLNRNVSVAMFDLDRFKSVNDRYGHDVGDIVIIAAVNAARPLLPPGGTLFRLGGEEFLCLLPHHDAERAERFAERLRAAFELAGHTISGHRLDATVSIGVAAASANVTAPELIKNADSALYRAKNTGRNRVVRFDLMDQFRSVASTRPDRVPRQLRSL